MEILIEKYCMLRYRYIITQAQKKEETEEDNFFIF